MKKFSKIGKRVLAFFLVALMNINAYAAVATNEGSEFVTKAEFDKLINNFNDEMGTYQNSLNAKIDGAIARYLGKMSSQNQANVIPYFISNAGHNSLITCRANNEYPYGKTTPGLDADVSYSCSFYNTSADAIYGKHYKWSVSKNGLKDGKRILVNETSDGGYRYVGYSENYGEKFDISYTYNKISYNDGFGEGTKYIYPFVWDGSQNTIFDNDQSTWKNGWATYIGINTTDGFRRHADELVCNVTIEDHDIDRVYDFVFDDNDNSSTATNPVYVYRFVDNQTKKFVAGEKFSLSNSDFDANKSISGDEGLYMLGYPNFAGYSWEPINKTTATSSFSGYSEALKRYSPISAPVEIGDGCKWSDIYYNDPTEYTYEKQTTETSGAVTATLKNYNMVQGLPLVDAKKGQKITWTYAFTDELTGRRIYLKYGQFNGTSVEGSDIEVFDASEKTGTITMNIKKSEMIFIKWTAGNTLDSANCSVVNRVNG